MMNNCFVCRCVHDAVRLAHWQPHPRGSHVHVLGVATPRRRRRRWARFSRFAPVLPFSRCPLTYSIDRAEFDRHASGFTHHIMYEHNTWNYVYLLAHLLSKPRTEMTGVEDYLLDRVVASDLTFFPLHRALSLQHRRDESDSETSDDEETSDSSSDDSVAGVVMPAAPMGQGGSDVNVHVMSTPRRRLSGSRPWSSANRRRGPDSGDDAGRRRGSGAGDASLVQQQVEAMQQLATRVEEALRTLQARGPGPRPGDGATAGGPPPAASNQASLVSEAARIIARRARGRRRSRGDGTRHRQRRVPSFRLTGGDGAGQARLL